MLPKKAVAIILILFLIIAIIFIVLYVNQKQAIAPSDGLGVNQTVISDEDRQEIVNKINAEIINQEENKTPEQKAADLKAQEARQKIVDQINAEIIK